MKSVRYKRDTVRREGETEGTEDSKANKEQRIGLASAIRSEVVQSALTIHETRKKKHIGRLRERDVPIEGKHRRQSDQCRVFFHPRSSNGSGI